MMSHVVLGMILTVVCGLGAWRLWPGWAAPVRPDLRWTWGAKVLVTCALTAVAVWTALGVLNVMAWRSLLF
jgi:hypothetical protein